MGLTKPTLRTLAKAPDFDHPQSIFDLVNYVVYEFLNVSGSLVTRMCERDHGVTREEWQLVAMLASLGPLSPSALAEATTLDRSQVSKTLRSVQHKGLVIRQGVAGDGRRALLSLTPAGRQLFEQIFPRVLELNQQVLGGISSAERRVLADALQRMQRNAHEVFEQQRTGPGTHPVRPVNPARPA